MSSLNIAANQSSPWPWEGGWGSSWFHPASISVGGLIFCCHIRGTRKENIIKMALPGVGNPYLGRRDVVWKKDLWEAGTEFFHGCSRGRKKRRISTNRIHLCPSSTLPINPSEMWLGLSNALPRERDQECSVSGTAIFPEVTPTGGKEGERKCRNPVLLRDFHVSDAAH